MKFYSLKAILDKAPDAKYYVIFGQRSNGKTFAVLEYGLDDYLKRGKQIAIVRRYKEDFRGKRAEQLFDAFIANPYKGNIIDKKTKGEWNSVKYFRGKWTLALKNEDGLIVKVDKGPFAISFALTDDIHEKSVPYPEVETILFDEFLTRDYYLKDEFVHWQNVISTIVRLRNSVRIFMCGNTVNAYNPYFSEMGLDNAKKMKKGTIDVYEYGDSGLKVAVEYSDFPAKKKKSDVYFAFNNPRLKMITGNEGATDWEMNIYPHCPVDSIRPKDIQFTYFIVFDREILQCEIVEKDDKAFTYIHRKTTPLKDDLNEESVIYQDEFDPRPNYARNLLKPTNEVQRLIRDFFLADKVFYQDNQTGETVRNYLMKCKTDGVIK